MFKKGEGRLWALVSLFVLTLAGCGGGGLDDLFGDPEGKLNSGDINTTVTTGSAAAVSVSGEFSRVPDGTVYFAIGDDNGLFSSSRMDIDTRSGAKFKLTLRTSPFLLEGRYSGQLRVYFCKDQYCNSQWDGSPRSLNYVITVASDPNAPVTPPVTPQKTSLSYDVVAGQAVTDYLSAQLNYPHPNGYWVASDSNALLMQQPAFGFVPTASYLTAFLGPTVFNTAGSYSGTISIHVYADAQYTTEYAGSPVLVPYSIVVH